REAFSGVPEKSPRDGSAGALEAGPDVGQAGGFSIW
ncbi:MAG: hypothetical protein QOG16_1199, partial [Actinomycetota bacterium]|nr:hypothetical protein [Actinomycetota bacterium]